MPPYIGDLDEPQSSYKQFLNLGRTLVSHLNCQKSKGNFLEMNE